MECFGDFFDNKENFCRISFGKLTEDGANDFAYNSGIAFTERITFRRGIKLLTIGDGRLHEQAIENGKNFLEDEDSHKAIASLFLLPSDPLDDEVALWTFLMNCIRLADEIRHITQNLSPAGVAEQMSTKEACPETVAKTLRVSREKINYEHLVRTLYENCPETIVFTSPRLLAYLKGLSGGQNVDIDASRIRKLQVWKEYKECRRSGKEVLYSDMSTVPDYRGAEASEL